jgi:hypothetical protein
MADGEVREVVAHRVGGEIILQAMVNSGKAIAYIHNGIQFIRLVKHVWKDSKGIAISNEVGGSNTGGGALGDQSLSSLMDMFSSTLEDAAHTHRSSSWTLATLASWQLTPLD